MKKLIFILSLALVSGCQDSPETPQAESAENSLFAITFRDYKDIDILRDHQKVSDTSIYTGDPEDDYRLLRLEENSGDLVLFYKVVDRDNVVVDNYSYQAIDTLHISNLKEDERISIGNCYNEAFYEGEIIAVVKETDSLQVQRIVRAWRANPESGSVEALEDFEGITCINEAYDSKGQPVSVEHLDLRSRAD